MMWDCCVENCVECSVGWKEDVVCWMVGVGMM